MKTTFSSCQPASRSSLLSHLTLGTYPVLLRHEMGHHPWGFARYWSHDPQGGDRTRNSRQNKNDSSIIILNSNLERSKAKEGSSRRLLSQPVGHSSCHTSSLPPPEQAKWEHRSIHVSSVTTPNPIHQTSGDTNPECSAQKSLTNGWSRWVLTNSWASRNRWDLRSNGQGRLILEHKMRHRKGCRVTWGCTNRA